VKVKAIGVVARPTERRTGHGITFHRAYLLSELVIRDLKTRYVGSTFGPAWAVLSPLLWVLLYSFVFSVVLRIPLSTEPAGVNFPEFLLAGFLPWLAVQEGISRSTTCLSDNASMVKKTVFSKQSLVATVVLSAVVNELIGLTLYSVYVSWRGHLSALWLVGLVPLLAIQVLITYGLGCLLAALNVFVRDTPQLVGLTLTMLSFLTPIFYPASLVPERYRWLVKINPFSHLAEAFRDVFFRHAAPATESLAYLVLFASIAATAGPVLFRRAEPHFADLL
jgi:lipopolysaccharide transport system permease protein